MQAKAELQVLDEPVRPVNVTGLTAQTGLIGHETGLTAQTTRDTNSAMKIIQSLKPKIRIWRDPIISYLKYPGHGAERNIRHMEFKYVSIDDELYFLNRRIFIS